MRPRLKKSAMSAFCSFSFSFSRAALVCFFGGILVVDTGRGLGARCVVVVGGRWRGAVDE